MKTREFPYTVRTGLKHLNDSPKISLSPLLTTCKKKNKKRRKCSPFMKLHLEHWLGGKAC